mmetsp:Transcript_83289/g.131083  ORF Transcript_83289/g.131083 Transcript_83289/m.131083 type:complete len:162 (+) Transcript_83289:74-559(+)
MGQVPSNECRCRETVLQCRETLCVTDESQMSEQSILEIEIEIQSDRSQRPSRPMGDQNILEIDIQLAQPQRPSRSDGRLHPWQRQVKTRTAFATDADERAVFSTTNLPCNRNHENTSISSYFGKDGFTTKDRTVENVLLNPEDGEDMLYGPAFAKFRCGGA